MKYLVKALVGLVVGVANGLFGSGGGTILVPALEKYIHIETHKAHATAIAIILPITLLSIFLYQAQTPWSTVIWISTGGIFGGYIGSRLLNKITAPWLRKIFGLFMMAAAVKMIF